ncbi:MAG: ATP-binding protein [Bacteroidetes bacterium]|nr:ATP-binding protein [Bacteroidota bacterium]
MKSFNIVIASDKSEIHKVEKLLEEVNNECDLEMEKFVNFQIAVSEALVNAIVHGNKENKNKKVFCDIECADKHMTVRIKDEGEGFDLNEVPDPTSKENILKEHGRGIYIIRSLVDEYECVTSDKGTEMILKVNK